MSVKKYRKKGDWVYTTIPKEIDQSIKNFQKDIEKASGVKPSKMSIWRRSKIIWRKNV